MNVKLNGNHRVHCPICEHIHYRYIKNGVITLDRFNEHPNDPLADDLYPMKAACRDYSEETYEENLCENLKDKAPAISIMEKKKEYEVGFMTRIWIEKFSHLTK